jgi:hypothetical protein
MANNPNNAATNVIQAPLLPYMAGFNLPYFIKWINETIQHGAHWPPMLTKLPFDIPKIEGRSIEDPSNHALCLSTLGVTLTASWKTPLD